MTEIDNTLHDSLDLIELRQEIAAGEQRQQAQRKRLRFYYWGLAGLFGLIAFALVGAEFSPTLARRTLGLVNVGLLVLASIVFLPRAFIAYHQHQAFARRLVQYAPQYVPRTTQWDTLNVVVSHALVAGAIVVAVVFNTTWYLLLLLFIGVRVFWFAYNKLLQWTYADGLTRTDQVLKFLPGNFYLLMNKAIILMNVGQLDEAIQIFQALLGRKNRRNIYLIPLLLNNLGCCFTFMKRYAEALMVLEASIRISPTINQTYDTLADWYLEQKADPERSLELTETALELNNPKDIASTAIKQATSGRALAYTGRDTRAEAMLEQALSAIPQLPAVVNAELNRQIGHARLAQGNQTAAVEHFQKAVALDPDGLYGKMAQEALETINPQPAS